MCRASVFALVVLVREVHERLRSPLAILSRGDDTGRMLRAHISAAFSRRVVVRGSANRTVNQSRPWESARHLRPAPPFPSPLTFAPLLMTTLQSHSHHVFYITLFIEHRISVSDARSGEKGSRRRSARAAAHSVRRREIRNNGGLKYNECDLKYITSATFPSRPCAHLFRLFCSCGGGCAGAGVGAGPITSSDLSLLITWFELEIR